MGEKASQACSFCLMSNHVSHCLGMSHNVQECLKMSRNISKCLEMSQESFFCLNKNETLLTRLDASFSLSKLFLFGDWHMKLLKTAFVAHDLSHSCLTMSRYV